MAIMSAATPTGSDGSGSQSVLERRLTAPPGPDTTTTPAERRDRPIPVTRSATRSTRTNDTFAQPGKRTAQRTNPVVPTRHSLNPPRLLHVRRTVGADAGPQ